MSGLSWNISICCRAAFGRRYLATLQPGVPPGLEGFAPPAPSLVASSRNGYAEWVIARAVRQAGPDILDGLRHLTKGFGAATGKWIGAGPWATLLHGEALARVGAATQALLAQWRADPSLLEAAGQRHYGVGPTRDALHVPASSVGEAIAIYDERRSRDDGDDLHCVVALVQAHAALAWHARNHGLALFHVTTL